MYTWDFEVLWRESRLLWQGFWVTLELSVLSILAGTVVAMILTLLSFLSPIGRFLARCYIETFLALPVLVILVWLYHSGPTIGIVLPGFWVGTLGLSLSLGAFVAESIRSGISAVPQGQVLVASMMQVPKFHVWKRIILPQALHVAFPSVLSQYISCIKLSSLCASIAVNELVYAARTAIAVTFRPLEFYTAVAVLYVLMIVPLTYVARCVEARLKFGMQ